jgi:SAM-dependent methyltransferase
MGRFETTAKTYAAHREPYPDSFFAAAAKRLSLTGREALIDLGTGPGLLAIGFAPYVARIVGVDPEPAMVAEARDAAMSAGLTFPVHLMRAEDVGAGLGRFDLVTIGRALHWMDREPTLASLQDMLAPGGHILVCGARSAASTPWRDVYERVCVNWSSGGEARNWERHERFFEDSAFVAVGDIVVEQGQELEAEALLERALARSTTSPAVLGDRVEAFKDALRAALAPYFAGGRAEEIVEAKGRVFARVGD